MVKLTTLASPDPRSVLLLFVATSPSIMSTILVQEKKDAGGLQYVPIYFISEALNGANERYSEVEKMAYVVVMASRKLKHYFTAHPIIFPTSYPLREVSSNRESTSASVNG